MRYLDPAPLSCSHWLALLGFLSNLSCVTTGSNGVAARALLLCAMPRGRTDGAWSSAPFMLSSPFLSPLSSPLSSLVAFSVGSFCVSGVIWSVPFEANATRSAHRWLLHRWLSVLFSFRSLPLSPPSLFNLALALSSSLSLLMLQFVQGSPTVASSPSIKLSHAAVSV